MKTTCILKSRHFIVIAMFFFAYTANAQLRVDSTGRVGIKATTTNLQPRLTVGDNTYYYSNSVGVAATPEVKNKSNIGVEGVINANSNFTLDKNYGVLGIVHNMNANHGRNYGVSGMIGPLGNGIHHGGAGVYGAYSTYYFMNPPNLSEAYAGYFVGPVNVTNFLTAPSIYTTSDSRLSDNIISLADRDGNGKETLKNVLNMNVLEYNIKSRLSENIPDDLDPERAEEIRQSYEFLKKEEQKMSSRHHFGIDAEELQKIYPDLVLEGQDGYLSVNYVELVPLLIRSIQELKAEIDELKGVDARYRDNAYGQTSESVDAQQTQIIYPITVDGKVIGTKRKIFPK